MVVNTKGQIVIPKDIRDKFGIYPGQEVEFQELNGKIVLVKKGTKDEFMKKAQSYTFKFPDKVTTTQQFINKVRGQ